MASERQKVKDAIKSDVRTFVADGRLPDVLYRIEQPSNFKFSRKEGHRVEGINVDQAFALGGHHIRITMSGMPEVYADLFKQRELRNVIFGLVDKYRDKENFAVAVVTKGLWQDRYRVFNDLLQAAIYRATEEVRQKNNGTLPMGLVLENVPHRYWVC